MFRVELNDLGRAFLKLEEFYRDGPEPSDDPEILGSGDRFCTMMSAEHIDLRSLCVHGQRARGLITTCSKPTLPFHDDD